MLLSFTNCLNPAFVLDLIEDLKALDSRLREKDKQGLPSSVLKPKQKVGGLYPFHLRMKSTF